jgi:hypothetical protein
VTKSKVSNDSITVDRRGAKDRRKTTDRRKKDEPVAVERRQGDRRKVQRRRQIDPTTCERDYTNDEVEFMNALDAYKRRSGRMFPTCSEILEVIRDLGYRKVEDMPADAELQAVEAELSAEQVTDEAAAEPTV